MMGARLSSLFSSALLTAAVAGSASAQGPVVRAVIFFLPTCEHCHEVIQEDLPVIFNQFGGPAQVFFDDSKTSQQAAFYELTNGRLQVLLIDVSHPQAAVYYRTWAEQHDVPQELWSVPRLIVGNATLLGSEEIPRDFPRLIEEGLAAGGIDWPDIAGFETALAAVPLHPQPIPRDELAADAVPGAVDDPDVEEAAVELETGAIEAEVTEPEVAEAEFAAIPSRSLTVAERFQRDAAGNSFAVVVLIGMLLSVVMVVALLRGPAAGGRLGYAVPVIAVIGIAVAAYLTYVETSGATAVCGRVGDCNTVNQSDYAMLFGLIPVGLLGLIGYAGILVGWLVARLEIGGVSDWATLAVLAMAMVGTVFSIYLTFLEPFVIGATCIWCLASAIAITALLWLSARPASQAWVRLSSNR